MPFAAGYRTVMFQYITAVPLQRDLNPVIGFNPDEIAGARQAFFDNNGVRCTKPDSAFDLKRSENNQK